jgi:glycosyltransferase involved in cell wall biosynthesis
MNKPLISVLIDSYNYARFIEEAIDSVLSQDYPKEQMQVLVVDDGSTDDTSERVRKYGNSIEYVRKENGGQASAFNVGFQHAKGDIVVLLDADDYFLPGKLRRIVEEFQKHPDAGMVYHARLELFSDTGNLKKEPEFVGLTGFIAKDKEKMDKYVPYPTSCLAVRRKIAERVLPIPESLKLQADGQFGFLIPLIAPIVAIAEPLAVYRLHGNNLFYISETAGVEEMQRRTKSFMNLMREVKLWKKKHKQEVKGTKTRVFFGRHTLPLEEQQFRIDPPGRLRFFSFLLRQNYVYSDLQTWKFTIYNYLSAVPALILGYKNKHLFYEWRRRMLERFESARARL